MKWTTNKPTKSGWYWFKDEYNAPVCGQLFIERAYNNILMMQLCGTDAAFELSELDGKFSSEPIPLPED